MVAIIIRLQTNLLPVPDMSRWIPPPAIWFKVYWDVHFLQNIDVVGLGIVIKGSFVQIIAGPSKKNWGFYL